MPRNNAYFAGSRTAASIGSRSIAVAFEMDYFPIFLDLRDQPVLVVGGGAVAERKVRLLLSAGARVNLVARQLSENLTELAKQGRLEWLAPEFEAAHVAGRRLVFAATDDNTVNRLVYAEAERIGVAVNVVDDAAHCRFISPAIVDRSPVQVAISTGGGSPVLARRLRRWIEQLLPHGLGRVAAVAASMRTAVKEMLPFPARRKFWEASLTDENLKRWSSGNDQAIRSELVARLAASRPAVPEGVVYLVGAGPGNPELLTLRALDVLGRADVILHDRLVSDEILDLARRDADRIYVGKQAGNHHRTQDEIHRIMLEQAALGRTVVRLKGGDAFVFGRGGEELQVLREAGVRYEVVPGLTAATACAAYSGIPLTHRDLAQTLTFVTGHYAATGPAGKAGVDWSAIAGEGKTAVVYMGVRQAGAISRDLLDAGLPADFPATLIEDGSLSSQRVLTGTVGSLQRLARRARKGRPGLLVIGRVAELGRNLDWFEGVNEIQTAA